MNTQLLIQMVSLAATNQDSKLLYKLALQLAVDPELGDEVTIENFKNEYYDVRSIRLIKVCMNFRLT